MIAGTDFWSTVWKRIAMGNLFKMRVKGYAGFQITTEAAYTRQAGQNLAIPLSATGGRPPYLINIGGANADLFIEDDTTLEWQNASTVAEGVYTVELTFVDQNNFIRTKTVTVTVNAAPVSLPGEITDLQVDAISPGIAKATFSTPTGTIVGYKVSINGSVPSDLPASRRLFLAPGVTHSVSIFAYNNDGNGLPGTDSVAMPEAGVNIGQEAQISKGFDEVNRNQYTISLNPGTGVEGKFIEVTVYSQAGVSHKHANLQAVGQTVTETLRVDSGTSLVCISKWTVPWTTGKPSTCSFSVDCVDGSGVLIANALRLGMSVRPIFDRAETPVATGSDTTTDANGEVHNTIASVSAGQLLTHTAASALTGTDCIADMFGTNPSANSEIYETALQVCSGDMKFADDATNYDVGAEFSDPVGGGDAAGMIGMRQVYCVYAAPSGPPTTGIQAEWSDDFWESLAVGLHTDFGRFNGTTNIWWWPGGLSGAYGALGSNNNPRCKNLPYMIGELGVRYGRSKWYDPNINNSNNTLRNTPAGELDDLSSDYGQYKRYIEYLYKKKGMRFYGPVGVEGDTLTNVRLTVEAVVAAFWHPEGIDGDPRPYIPLYGMEGINEMNKGHTVNDGWAEECHAFQKAIYQRAQQLVPYGTTGVRIIMPSIWERRKPFIDKLATIGATGDKIWDYCTHGCIHIYNGGREPNRLAPGEGGGQTDPDRPFEETYDDHRAINQTLPVMVTENGFRYGQPQMNSGVRMSVKGFTLPYGAGTRSGWQAAPDNWVVPYGYNNITWYSAAKYFPRMLLEYWTRRNITGHAHANIYSFVDDVDTRPNLNWSITYPNQAENLIVPKLPYYAVKRMGYLFSNKTWDEATYTWLGSRPTLGSANYSLRSHGSGTGPNDKTGPIMYDANGVAYPQPGYLTQHGSGASAVFRLWLFQREVSWDNTSVALPTTEAAALNIKTAKDFDFSRDMTLDFGGTAKDIKIYRVAFDSTGGYTGEYPPVPYVTDNNKTSKVITVPDHPICIEWHY